MNPAFAGVAFGWVFVKVAKSKFPSFEMHPLSKRPTYLLHLLWLGCLAVCAATAWLALQPPWLGVQLAADGDKVRVLRAFDDLTQPIPKDALVQQLVSATGEAMEIRVTDLIEEPDFFNTYPEMADFFARQSAFYNMLHTPRVTLIWTDQNGVGGKTVIKPKHRSIADLPAVFWFQIAVGCVGFLMASWVFLLRTNDWGARMFWLTGLMFPVFTVPAAIYSTRELALSGETFRLLASLNHAGAFLFGCGLVALFLTYPRKLVSPRSLLWLPAIFGSWLLADVLRWAPDQDWGSRFPVMLEMLLAILFAIIQWRKTRGQPLERAALRWLILSGVVGSSLFVMNVYSSSVMGFLPVLSQGYSFGFFLVMYVGIALGLRRYHLFDMDEWAYRVFLWVAGATSVIALDALLIFTGVTEGASLGISLLLCGWLYFPFRQWLWQRIVIKQSPNFESLLPEISAIAFTASVTEQQARWEALLRRIFDPLVLKATGEAGSGLREEGLGLLVPGCGKLPVYALRYAGRGARLFSTRDAVFAATLVQLLEQVMSGRSSYEQGVTQERLRIGRDLHDNIGARLLKLIHHLRGTPDVEVARDAMKDLRTAIASMDAHPVPLPHALADWRAEAGSRCEAAGCRLLWQQNDELPAVALAPRTKAMLESVMREIITNALKHATPSRINVEIAADAARLRASVENDGAIADPLTWKDGYGLRNLRGRLEELGGNLSIAAAENEVRLTIEIPLT